MSEVSAEEKRRILRERRQAKLAHGNASSRLNKILNNSSVPIDSEVKEGVSEGAKEGVDEGVNEGVKQGVKQGVKEGAKEGVKEGVKETEVDSQTKETEIKDSATGEALKDGVSEGASNDDSNQSDQISISKNSPDFLNPPDSKSLHDDPEGPDISSLLRHSAPSPNAASAASEPEEFDMDSLLKQIFNGSDTQNPQQSQGADFFANMMKAVSDDAADMPQSSGDASFHTNMNAYLQYQQKQLNARFAMVRFVVHVANFVYHYRTQASFRSSAYAYIRNQAPMTSTFAMYFVSAEIAFISAYFYLMSSRGLLQVASSNNPISKLLSMASAVFPPANAYQPLVNNLLVYWGGASILISDVSLVVLMFGVMSIFQ